MKRIIILSAIIILGISVNANDFDNALFEIVSNNPTLAASIAENEAEINELKSENNLPDPEIGYEHKWGKEGAKWGIDISQSFEWPGAYSARRKAINSSSEAIEYLNKSNYLNKLVEIKLLLIDIINLRKQISLVSQLESQIDSLTLKYQQGAKQGEVTILDINKLKIEKIALTRQSKELRNQLNNFESTLLVENGGNDISSILAHLNSYPKEAILSIEKYEELLREYDPEIAQYSSISKAQEYNHKALNMSKFPGFSIGYKLENELGTYFNGFSVGISIPTFSKRHKKESIIATQKAISLQSNALEIEKIAQINVLRTNAISLFQEMEEYRPTLEDTNNIELLKKALDGGQINLITYIQEVNFFLEAQQNFIDIEYRYHQTLASLNKYTLLQK